MSVVWDEPPKAQRGRWGFEKSPLRKEVDTMLEEVKARPGQWARLYDMPDQEDANKRAGFIRSTVNKQGWNVAVRQTEWGYSIFARYKLTNSDPDTGTFD